MKIGTILALVLGMQVAYAYRAEIAMRYPPARPVLESACSYANCTVPWINQDGALKLEDSELLEVPGKPGQIALNARIRLRLDATIGSLMLGFGLRLAFASR